MNRLQLYDLADSLQLNLSVENYTIRGGRVRSHMLGNEMKEAEFKIIASYVMIDSAAVLCKVLGNVGVLMIISGGKNKILSNLRAAIVDLSRLPAHGVSCLNKKAPATAAGAVAEIEPGIVKWFERNGREAWKEIPSFT